MTTRDRKALGRYCRMIADRMELRDWHLDVMHDPPDTPRAFATCEPIYGQRRARLRFCVDFREMAPEDQRNVVVHELIHCHLAAVQSQVRRDLEDHLGKQSDLLFHASFERNIEYAVDSLAAALAKHLPLVAWPK